MSLQLQCMFYAAKAPISQQATITDADVRWLITCPDTVMYVVFNRPTDGLQSYLTTRLIAALKAPPPPPRLDPTTLFDRLYKFADGWGEAQALAWSGKIHAERGNISPVSSAVLFDIRDEPTTYHTYPIRHWLAGSMIKTMYAVDNDTAECYAHRLSGTVTLGISTTHRGMDLTFFGRLPGGSGDSDEEWFTHSTDDELSSDNDSVYDWAIDEDVGPRRIFPLVDHVRHHLVPDRTWVLRPSPGFPFAIVVEHPYGRTWMYFDTKDHCWDYFARVERNSGLIVIYVKTMFERRMIVEGVLRGGTRPREQQQKNSKAPTPKPPRTQAQSDQDHRRKTTRNQLETESAIAIGLQAAPQLKNGLPEAASALPKRKNVAPPVSSGQSSSSSDIPYEVQNLTDELADDSLQASVETKVEGLSTSVMEVAISTLKTSATDMRQSMVNAVTSMLVSARGHTTGEPDYDEQYCSWIHTFTSCGEQWYFDARVTEHDRIHHLNYAETLPIEDGVEYMSRYFKTPATKDAVIDAQIEFGHGSRNFREYPPSKFDLGLAPLTRKPPPMEQLAVLYTHARRSNASHDVFAAAVAFASGKPTPADHAVLYRVLDALPAVSTSPELRDTCCDFFKLHAIKTTGNKELFVPDAPPPPPDDIQPPSSFWDASPHVRYATSLNAPEAEIPAEAMSSFRSLGLRFHLAIARFIEGFAEGAITARTELADFVAHNVEQMSPLIKLPLSAGVAVLSAGLPLWMGTVAAFHGKNLYKHTGHIFGAYLYPRKIVGVISDQQKLACASLSPTQNMVCLSTDAQWIEDLNAGDVEPELHVIRSMAGPTKLVYPVYRVAALLNASSAKQVTPDEPEEGDDEHDLRNHLHRKADILDHFPHIEVMHVYSTNERFQHVTELLVAKSIYEDIIATPSRYLSLLSTEKPYDDLLSVVNSDVTRAAASINLPMPPKGRHSVQYETAVAAAITLWALIRERSPGVGNV